jgi:endonuclease G
VKFIKSFILFFSFFLTLNAAQSSCNGIYFANTAPDIINSKLLPKTTEICYKQFAIMHSGISKTPLWSAEHLTRAMLLKKAKRENDFHPDEHLRENERAELKDYLHSHYDRGHLSPSGDFDNTQSNHECFTLANMIPQNHENNSGIWADIESTTRYFAKKQGEIYVISGPLFLDKSPHYIGNKVRIPTQIFKAIYIPSSGQGGAYITDNAPNYKYKIISISELEKLSGISFFPKMSKSAKEYAPRLPEPKPSNQYKQPKSAYQHTDDNTHDNSFLGKLRRKVTNFYYRE